VDFPKADFLFPGSYEENIGFSLALSSKFLNDNCADNCVPVSSAHAGLHEIRDRKRQVKIPGFYVDWANPTYQIVRILVLAFMLIVIFLTCLDLIRQSLKAYPYSWAYFLLLDQPVR
jgi:hypothetical protein